MSAMSKLNEVVEQLELAEKTLGEARKCFHHSSMEYQRLDSQFEVVGDAVSVVKSVMARVESRLIRDVMYNRTQRRFP